MRSTMMDGALTIGGLLRQGAAEYSTSRVITATGDEPRVRTFGEVADRAAQLAGALRELGVQPDDRVATFLWNNAEHLEAYLAVPAMGAVLHTLNIRLAAEQIVYIAEHAEDKVVLVDHSLLGVFGPLADQLKTVEHVVVVNGPVDDGPAGALAYEDLLAAQPTTYDWPEVDEFAAAAMCYTSGTTGNPKGVVYSHRSTWLHALMCTTSNVAGISENDTVLPIVPMFHANAWGYPYGAWMAGSDIVFPHAGMSSAGLADTINRTHPTVSAGVPTIFNDLYRYGETNDLDLASFRLLFCGGAAVPLSLMKRYHEKYSLEIIQGWGMTETSPVAAISRVPKGVEEGTEEGWTYRAKTGRLLLGVECRIVGEDGSVLPADGQAVGEFEVRGPWVTGAYYRDEDPSRFHDGWLKTGDVGTLDPRGYQQITDRSKDVIKSGGEWISSVDLENLLAGHDQVSEAAVVGVPDPRWDERPLACVVRTEGSTVTAEELRDFVAGQVAKFWVPERWAFIDAVPRTSVGKYDKKVLRRQYADEELEVTTL